MCAEESPVTIPLVVDLDGTLIAANTLVEGAILLLKRDPLYALRMLGWLAQGKARLKACIAEKVTLDVAYLPYQTQVLEYLRAAQGRRLVLATAADVRVARQVADYLGMFDEVLASDGVLNLAGVQKQQSLVQRFGEQGYDYIGNALSDIAVWRCARIAVVVGGSSGLRSQVAKVAQHVQFIEVSKAGPADYMSALRLHHWPKNLLLFAPLVAAHQHTDMLFRTLLGFLAFSLCASAVYLLNDLMDMAADRHHPHKRERPIASGRIPLSLILPLLPMLLAASIGLSLSLPQGFIMVIGGYLSINILYSLYIKMMPIVDVLVLAGFHSLRIIAGSVVTAVPLSSWLLAFAMFLFLSLALVKRYAELMTMQAAEGAHAKARCYQQDDAELLATFGANAGYISVLVLALYIGSGNALYAQTQVLWALCVLLLYWISHVWLMAHRRRMDDDPLVFALRNPASLCVIILMALVLVIAA